METSEKKSLPVRMGEYIKANYDVVRDLADSAALIILALYPFRNIHRGLDLWDTGYSYANFEYMGTGSMDPMWLFSTYLSNGVGHLLSLLPYGHTLRGMNFYTSFIPAIIAVLMYLVFSRMMKIPAPIAFLGEFIALSMCWAPTAVLYHYLTYMVITFSAAVLYQGLVFNKKSLLILSGVICGIGIYVRFSNLPQYSLILAIWMYGIFEFREAFVKSDGVKLPSRFETLIGSFVRGLWFTLGYVGGAFLFLVYLGIRYGFVEYIKGVTELFSIPDNASDYSTVAMILKLIKSYTDQLYWVIRLLGISVIGGLLYFGACFVYDKFIDTGAAGKGSAKRVKFLRIFEIITGLIICAASIAFLMVRKNPFVTFNYNSYYCVFALAGFMAFCALAYAVFGTFSRNAEASKRLVAVLTGYTLLISAIGSNNGAFSEFNDMFFWFPCLLAALFELWRSKRFAWLYGFKCVLSAVFIFFLVQSTGFGFNFAFAEGEFGAGEERNYIVTDNRALKGIRMSYDKAYSFERLSAFVDERGLGDRELISYGYIPGMSFYLQMRPAFNAWPDLDSYDISKFSAELDAIRKKMDSEGEGYEKPVVILNISPSGDRSDNERKWQLIYDYLDDAEYKLVYIDTMFALYE